MYPFVFYTTALSKLQRGEVTVLKGPHRNKQGFKHILAPTSFKVSNLPHLCFLEGAGVPRENPQAQREHVNSTQRGPGVEPTTFLLWNLQKATVSDHLTFSNNVHKKKEEELKRKLANHRGLRSRESDTISRHCGKMSPNRSSGDLQWFPTVTTSDKCDNIPTTTSTVAPV